MVHLHNILLCHRDLSQIFTLTFSIGSVGKPLTLEFNITVYFHLEKYCQNYIVNTNIDILFSVKYEKIKFLVIALRDSIEIYAWAPKPYHKFMAFKVIHSSWS